MCLAFPSGAVWLSRLVRLACPNGAVEPEWRLSTLAYIATDDGFFDPTESRSAPGTPISMLASDASERCLKTIADPEEETKLNNIEMGVRGR